MPAHRVIHFHFGTEGGAERFFASLVRALHARGVEQHVFMRPGRTWRADIAGAAAITEGVYRHVSLSRYFLQAKRDRLIRSFRPTALMGWAGRGSRMLPARAGCIRVSRLGDYPLSLKYFPNSDVIVGNTPGIVERVRELGWQRESEVISNFTLFTPAPPADRAALNTPAGAFLVVGVGRFVPRKGFHRLIEAVAGIPGAWLWLLGEGEERANLEALAARLGAADRIRFLGWQKNPAPYLAAADAFVMPSSHEPLGNVILEAWAAGVPVVSTRAEGPVWMMRDGIDCLLVPIDDADAMRAALLRLAGEPTLGAQLIAGGRETLAARFSVEAVTDAYLDLFSRAPRR